MALLKKVSPLWAPAEKPDLKVGETQEISDYTSLVRQGLAVLVDEAGTEIPLPDSKLTCPVCYQQILGTLVNFTQHVTLKHAPAVASQKETEVKAEETPKVEVKPAVLETESTPKATTKKS